MDTSRAAAGEIAPRVSQTGTAKRQQRSVEEKRRIVEETLVEGASVATHGMGSGDRHHRVFRLDREKGTHADDREAGQR